MLQWCELHPYNANHTYRLAGPLDVNSLRQAIQDTFEHNGFGVAEVDPVAGWYRHTMDDSPTLPEVDVIDGDEDPEDRLAVHVTRELNRSFERPVCRPFRFGVIDAGPESHYVSMTYDHWVADSIGARLVMRHILGRYLDLDIPENEQRLDLYPGRYREVFSDRLRGPMLALPVLRSFRTWLGGNRSTWRAALASVRNMDVGYALHHLRPGTVDELRQFARDHEASVNDVFLAAMCRALAAYLPKKRSGGAKSHNMNLGTIVDTRCDANVDLSESLGTFLGYYVVRAAGDGRIGLGELSRRIAVVTREKKKRRSYLDSAVNYSVAGAVWPRLKPESRLHFARRALPLTAGISNVFLRNTWIDQQGAGRVLDYHRTVSNGPTLPLVLSPTTLGGQLNVAVSYRVTGFSQAKISGIMDSFVDQLETLDAGGKAAKPVKVRGRELAKAR